MFHRPVIAVCRQEEHPPNSSNKGIATSNKGITTGSWKLLVTPISLEPTLDNGRPHLESSSRRRIATKGAVSGHSMPQAAVEDASLSYCVSVQRGTGLPRAK